MTRTRTVDGKTETYTEQERYTVWHYVSGSYSHFFDDVLIPASGQYDAKLLDRLGDFRLDGLLGYKPDYLSGYVAERYSIGRSGAGSWRKRESPPRWKAPSARRSAATRSAI